MDIRNKIRYLLRRAGFGATPLEAQRWADNGLESAVDELLGNWAEPEAVAPPNLGSEPYNETRLSDIRTYWIHRMVVTRRPLVEKMTLFWHGHFTTGASKVKPICMVRQNELIRRNALGSFPNLLKAIAKDAAMLLWLDGHRSSKSAPNENYAREVMELFTTGPGPYSEADVQQAARALTGWWVDQKTWEAKFNPRAWDSGVKTFLGRTGTFGADDIAAILSTRPETPVFLANKLWRFFAAAAPDAPTIQSMVAAYNSSQGEIRPMLRALFLSEAFYAAGPLIKSPAELVAGTLRLLGIPASRDAAAWCTRMGQGLFDPPNVAGWPGGSTWLGEPSLLARWNFGVWLEEQLNDEHNSGWLNVMGPHKLVDYCLDFFGMNASSAATKDALLAVVGDISPLLPGSRWELIRHLIGATVASPEYQTT